MKKHLIILFLILNPWHFIFSQSKTIDSLKILIKNANHDSIRVNNLLLIANEYYRQNPDTAIKYCEQALSQAKKINFKEGIASAQGWLGYLYDDKGELVKSAQYDSLSLIYYKEIDNKEAIASTLTRISHKYKIIGNLKAALNCLLESLAIREKTGNKKGIASSLSEISVFYVEQCEINNAYEYAKKALQLRIEAQDSMHISTSYLNISYIFNILGETEKAIEYVNKGILTSEKVKDFKSIAVGLNNIANIYEGRNEITKALEYQYKSLKIRRDLDNKTLIASSLNNLAALYQSQGDYQKALNYFNESLNLFVYLNNKRLIANTTANIGGVHIIQGNQTKALELFTKSLEIRKEINDQSGVVLCLTNISSIYEGDKNYLKAIELNNKALKISESIKDLTGSARALHNLGRIYLKTKDYTNSKFYIDKSIESYQAIGNNKYLREAFLAKSDLHIKLNQYSESEKYQLKLIELNNKIISDNFAILSEKEKGYLLATLDKYFSSFISFTLLQKSKNKEINQLAFNETLKRKGLLLKSSTGVRNAILESKDSVLINKYNNWIALKKKIAQLQSINKDTKVLEEKTNDLEKELVQSSATFNESLKNDKLTWKNVQDRLLKNEAAIEFVNFTDKEFEDSLTKITYCALLIKPNSKYPEMIRLFEEKELRELLDNYKGNNYNYVSGLYGDQKNSNSELYDLIWKPIHPYLKGIRNIYLSPTGLLHKVSFAAISKKKGECLSDEFELNMVSSTGKVAIPDNFTFENTASTTVYGGVNYNTDSTKKEIWKYLEGTKTETEKISFTLKEKNISVNYINGADATEDQFKKNAHSANILHIATHGFFYPDPEKEIEGMKMANKKINISSIDTTQQNKPEVNKQEIAFRGSNDGFGIWNFVKNKNPLMRSGLVLAGANDVWNTKYKSGNEEDGVLTAAEVATMDLRKTGLVVLSACETGLGDIKGSEGVYGLQRAFKMAGVKYIIMSLWQVPDKETSEFMTTFYTHLTVIKDIKKAFNQTQHEMRKKYDPYFWAAFVLVE